MSTPAKIALGKNIADRVKDSELIGLGTGSTVDAAILAIGERIQKEGIRVSAITTSLASTKLAVTCGITIVDFGSVSQLDWGFDGADEVTTKLQAIKGGGAAMYSERCMAVLCKNWILVAENSKLVEKLGKRAVPLELDPKMLQYFMNNLPAEVSEARLRLGSASYGATYSERGNLILDLICEKVDADLANRLKLMQGVIDHGIFLEEASELLISDAEGKISSYTR